MLHAGPVPAVPSLEQRLPRDTHGELRPQLHVVLEPVPARGRHEEIAGRSEERQDDDDGDAATATELAFLERDIGFEPTTFSLGMRSRGIGRGSSR